MKKLHVYYGDVDVLMSMLLLKSMGNVCAGGVADNVKPRAYD